MAKVRTTLTIDDSVLRAVKVRTARSGRGDSEVIEEALRRDLDLDFLERISEQALSAEDAAGACGRGAARHPELPTLTRAGVGCYL